MQKIQKILIANRSEIAVRIINACRLLGISTVAVYSEADVDSKHCLMADKSVCIGHAPPLESYLDIDKIIAAAKEKGCDAIHPGYGFLAENPELPERCSKEGIIFIGPTAESMRLMGNKIAARVKMAKAGVPLIPGMTASSNNLESFSKAAKNTGYPVMIKAAAGGGGKGMRLVNKDSELATAVEAAKREAASAFGDDRVYLEKYISNPRHIEFQILADHHGNCVHLFERECSIQRRHQKIIEETPSVALDDNLRMQMGETAVKVARISGYNSAGTVEFLVGDNGNYYFLEMNTRIQVEHPITEMVTGVDIVVEQISIASGEKLSVTQSELSQQGHAIECRLYAEDGENNFMPSTGKILYYSEPTGPGIRVDSGIAKNTIIDINYDPIMAKLIVHATDRATAIAKMIIALNEYHILGVKNSKRFMVDILKHPHFQNGKTYTNFIDTNMSERGALGSSIEESTNEQCLIAAAVASVIASIKTNSSAIFTGEDQLLPWQIIGSWQIGDSI